MPATSPQSQWDTEAEFRRTLSPSLFTSWQMTCNAFGAAVAAGPGLVLLVGGPGSGKTFTLLAYAGGTTKKVGLRSLDDPMEPDTEIDLVDNVHAGSLARLTPFDGTRALAVEPALAEHLLHVFPEARIVAMRPMQPRDVHMMVEVRRPQLGLPVGYFTSKALACLDELCTGNPRRLDDLLFRSLRLAASAAAARVSPAFVERAALQIGMAGTGEDTRLLDREAALRLTGGTGKSSQPWRQRADAPGFWPGGAAARRDMRRAGGPSARPPGKQAAAPKLAGQAAPLLTVARKAGPVRDETLFALAPAEAARAGRRRRRTGRQASVAAAVAIVALAVAARNVPGLLPGDARGVHDMNGAASVSVALLPPVAPPPFPDTVPSPIPAPAARPVSPANALPPGGQVDPAAPRGAAIGIAAVPEAASAAIPEAVSAAVSGAVPRPAAPARSAAAIAELQGARLPDGPGQAGVRPRSAARADGGPAPAAPAAPTASFMAPALPADTAPAPRAVAVASAAPAIDPPRSLAAVGQRPPPSPDAAKLAARLLALGKALLAISQVADARELIKASADMGDDEAAALLAAFGSVAQRPRHMQAGQTQPERPGTRARPAARAVP